MQKSKILIIKKATKKIKKIKKIKREKKTKKSCLLFYILSCD